MNVNSLFLRLPAEVARADAMEAISAQLRERQSILAVGSYVLAAHRDQWFEVRCPEGEPGPLGAVAGALGSTIYALGSALSRAWQVETVALSTDGAFLAFEHNAPGRRSDAPVEMREAWVGLRLPVVDDASAGVVLVDRENALSQLFARSPPASMFFRMRPEPAWGTGALISLPAEICRISGALWL
ncbi:MAG: hypothetical protein Q8S33_31155 [Myxococcales bacterium]|nr:hypothetical protein [Myxococcales bacterium]